MDSQSAGGAQVKSMTSAVLRDKVDVDPSMRLDFFAALISSPSRLCFAPDKAGPEWRLSALTTSALRADSLIGSSSKARVSCFEGETLEKNDAMLFFANTCFVAAGEDL